MPFRVLRLVLVLLAVAVPAAPAAAAPALLPWPSNEYTKLDPSTDTGLRLDLGIDEMPANAAGVPIDPTAFNRNDGFSPGTLIIAQIRGLDTPEAFARNRFPTNVDPGRSFDPDQRAVLIDATDPAHPRQLIWAELEYPDAPAAVQTLVIHPGKNLAEGHRYIVALRNLRTADNSKIAPVASPAVRPDMLATLDEAGIDTDQLYTAWDFTVASERNLSERMLQIRDTAFAQLGDENLADLKVEGDAPVATVYPDLPDEPVRAADVPEVGRAGEDVDGVTNFAPCDPTGCKAGQSDRLLRIVRGRVVVPCFLNTPGCATGGTFVYGLNGLPLENPATKSLANFVCIVPRSVLTRGPARPALYGHGLLGDAGQVAGGAQQALASEQNIMSCATDWIGMATEDVPNALVILANLSRFDSLADRVQQGMLNFLFLGRSIIHDNGLMTDPAFQVDGKPVADTSRLYYTGGSQGGIIGGSLTAVAPDFTRASLGVPAMNYSILLQRSIDFDTYAQVMYNAYPDKLERPLVLSLIQLQWDRAEANGYAQHMTSDPYPNTPPHEVNLSMAYGDHQVTNWATYVMARTVGARLRTPALEPFRAQGDEFFGIETIPSFPTGGSQLLVSDVGPLRQVGDRTKGTPPPPVGNVPNREGVDPHGPDASEQMWARAQVGAFLRPEGESRFIAVCDDRPCYLDGWDGTP